MKYPAGVFDKPLAVQISTPKVIPPFQNPASVLGKPPAVQVSTKNNGGFIQVRTRIDPSEIVGKVGVKIKVKGNGDIYYLHIRNGSARLPWHYYTATFQTNEKWQEILIPFNNFEKSATFMPRKLSAETIKTLGVVAYGRNHEADVAIANLEFY